MSDMLVSWKFSPSLSPPPSDTCLDPMMRTRLFVRSAAPMLWNWGLEKKRQMICSYIFCFYLHPFIDALQILSFIMDVTLGEPYMLCATFKHF